MEINIKELYCANNGKIYSIKEITPIYIYGHKTNLCFYLGIYKGIGGNGRSITEKEIFDKNGKSINEGSNLELSHTFSGHKLDKQLSAVEYLKLKIKKLEKEVKDLEGK